MLSAEEAKNLALQARMTEKEMAEEIKLTLEKISKKIEIECKNKQNCYLSYGSIDFYIEKKPFNFLREIYETLQEHGYRLKIVKGGYHNMKVLDMSVDSFEGGGTYMFTVEWEVGDDNSSGS